MGLDSMLEDKKNKLISRTKEERVKLLYEWTKTDVISFVYFKKLIEFCINENLI